MTSGVLTAPRLDDAQETPTPAGPKRSGRKWLLGAGAFVMFGLGVGFVARNEVQTNTKFDRTHDSLSLTRHQDETVLADLASVRQQLRVVDGQVRQSTTSLTSDTAQLHDVQGDLTDAQANVATQGSDITDLQSCLGGVEQALNALSVGDQASALAALNAVSTTCQSALSADG